MVIVDRFSGWPEIAHCGATTGSSSLVVSRLREFFSRFGVPEELATDGARVYTSYEVEEFLQRYGVRHMVSSAMFPHSNQRAELGVKVSKRLIRENTGPGGTLNTDKFCRAMMAYRNTLDRDTSRSPAEVLFGRLLRDHLPNPGSRYKPREEWRLLARDRESALAKRAARNSEELTRGTRDLGKLTLGAHVRVQNQTREKPTRWDNTGVVVEVKGFDQYVVKMDGTGRLSMRNRKFLRKFIPYGKSDPITQYHDNDDASFRPTPRSPESDTQCHDDDDSSIRPTESGESSDDYNDGGRPIRI